MERAIRSGDGIDAVDVLAQAVQTTRPVSLAGERLLPVLSPLAGLLPWGGLARGSVVAVTGVAGTSLALALAAGPSAQGSWVGALGLPSLGLLAAAELGVALDRFVLVAAPSEWATVLATLLDGVDIVLTTPARASAGEVRRLTARVRERGAVLCLIGSSTGWAPEVVLDTAAATWQGLHQGAGHLRGRRIGVSATGRRAAGRPRRAELWLPDEAGAVALAEPVAPVVALRGAS